MVVTWVIAATAFLADFLLKGYLHSKYPFQSIPLIKNIFHITIVFNKGAAFGILQKSGTFLIYVSILFFLLLFFLIKREKIKSKLFLVACGLIIGGALSNLWDRLFLGYVVDYIDLRVWPVFNLSDSCIMVGAGFLFWDSCKKKIKNS